MGESAVYTNILKQLLFSYAVNIIVFVIAPIGTFVLSRGLSVSDFGVYALFFGWWNIGLQAGPLGIQLFIYNFLPGKSLSEQRVVMGTLFKFITFLLVLYLFFWFSAGDKILSLINLNAYSFEYRFTFFAIAMSIFSYVLHGWITARQDLVFANFLNCVNSSLWILLALVEFSLIGKIVLWHVMLFWIFGAFLQFLLSLLKLGKNSYCLIVPIKVDCAWGIIKSALVFGLPLGPLVMSSWLLTAFDRSLLSLYEGSAALGLYALAYSIVNIVASFGNLVANIFYPYIAKAHNLGQRKECAEFLNASFKYTLLIVLPGIMGVYALRTELITLFSSSKFLGGEVFVKYLILFPLFSSVILVLQSAVLVHKKSVSASLVYISSFFINYFLNRWLIPLYGGIGAAIATVLTYFVLVLFMLVLSRGLFKFEWNFIKPGRILLCSFGMAVVLFFLNPQTAFFKFSSILMGIFIYVAFILLSGVFGKEEFVIAKSLLVEKLGRFSSFLFRFNF